MRPISVLPVFSSLRSARSQLAEALALTVALLSMTLAAPAAHAQSGTVIESFGSTSLVQVGNSFYFYPVGGSSGPQFQYAGPVTVGRFPASYIGAEKTASGYQVALRVGSDQYTVWITDNNGNVIGNGTGGVVVSGSSSVLKSLEPSFKQDLNGDGIIGTGSTPSATVIESFGSTSLMQVGNSFYFYPVGGSSGPQFQYAGPVTVGRFPASYIGAEKTASGYQVALRVGVDQYTVWITDNNGNVIGNGTGGVVVSGSSSVLKSLEPSFNQDLNGDGVIGVVAAPVSGVCGAANGTTIASKPSANLCAAGTASSVAGSGPWTWSCGGSNGGAGATCAASLATANPTPTPTPTPGPVSGNCSTQSGGTAFAFCETFDQGPSAVRGRGGDLDPSKWATARVSGDIGLAGPGNANPVAIGPIPQCRAGITQTSVFPPNDTLICDPSGTRSSRLMTAVSMQNYGVNSYMVRQPFDFAGRTGKIVFDVDAVDQGGLGGFIEVELTEDPTPATTFREFQNFEAGPVPRNGLTLRFSSFAECPSAVAPVNTMVYKNYAGTIIPPTFSHNNGCAKTNRGSLNRFEIHVSQSRVDVYGSDFSADNGETYPNFKLLYSANINLNFSRGYLHFNPRNHATVKYGYGPNVVFHWDNIGFDGPVIASPKAYEIPDNTFVNSYNGNQVQNLGYPLLDGTSGKPAGIYNLSTKLNSLTFQNVNTSGVTSAVLTMNAFFNASVHTASLDWGISYRFNGGAWRNRNLTAGDIAAINTIAGAPYGQLSMSLDVPVGDLVSGNNTLELLPLNAPMDYPPVVANIDLLLGTSGSVNPSPTPSPTAPTVAFSANPTSITSGKISTMNWSSSGATSCMAAGGWTGARAPSGKLVVSPQNTTTYMLTCTGSGGTSPMASTTVAVNGSQTPVSGACGSANGTTVSVAPSANLCNAGTATSVVGSGLWTWSCAGTSGGSSASCSASAGSASGSGGTTPTTPGPVAGNCGMQLGGAVSFCETFDTKNPGIPSRTGDLDPNVWGVSRAIGETNFAQGMYNGWAATTQLQTCNGTKTVAPPNDIMICNGQLRQASNDNPTGVFDAGTVTVLAMYPKQPFDFAGRTGTVSFDVSNDSHGIHAAWPEFWMSNLPIPAPFNHFDSWQSLPEHGFGIRFAAAVAPGGWGSCPNGNNLDKRRWTVDSAVVIRNYVMDDTVGLGGVRTKMAVKQLDCVIAPPDNSGITNHVELRISQNQIDIYATDAGVTPSPANLRRIAVVTDANLSLTRGLIWIQDVHYNADKAESGPNVLSQRQHTFVWDNVAFDGPFTYRDFSYDALDVNQPNAATKTVDLGKPSLRNQTASWNVLNMPANPKAAAVRVLFNFWQRTPVSTMLNVIVNGHAHSVPWPYPDSLGYSWRTYAVTIPITDLVPGTNVVQIGSDQDMITSNVNIVLVDVPGGVPVLPGSNNAYPASQVSQ